MNLQGSDLNEIRTRISVKEIFFLTIIYLAFIALVLPDTGFGVSWNDMRIDFVMPLEAAGGITIVLTLCSTISGFSSGYLLNRFRTGKVTAFSCLATAIALIGYCFSGSYFQFLY